MINSNVLQAQRPKQNAECGNESNYKLTELAMA
jgi:hypothetical protein